MYTSATKNIPETPDKKKYFPWCISRCFSSIFVLSKTVNIYDLVHSPEKLVYTINVFMYIVYSFYRTGNQYTHHVQKLGRISRWIYFTKIQEEINTVTKLGKTHIQKKCFFLVVGPLMSGYPPPKELSCSWCFGHFILTDRKKCVFS